MVGFPLSIVLWKIYKNYIQKWETPLIKISNLLFLLDKLSSKNMSYACVLHNNDLLLLIKSFV